MHKIKLISITVLALSLGMEGCTDIFEERLGCPCLLTLYKGAADTDTGIDVSVFSDSGSTLFQSSDILPQGQEKTSLQVPKGRNTICYWQGVKYSESNGSAIRAKAGKQADRLRFGRKVLDCSGESVADTISLHKEWSTMDIILVSGGPEDKPFPYGMEVEANWNGIDTRSGKALEGEFRCSPTKVNSSRSMCVIPRQDDNSLALVLSSPGTEWEDKLEIGKMLEKQGFDWQEPDLADIKVMIDFSEEEIRVQVSTWQELYFEEYI